MMMTSSDSSQFAPCKYAALREFIFTTERKQLAQGILGKATLTSIVEDFRKANPSAELPCSLLSYLTWDEVIAAVIHNDINKLSTLLESDKRCRLNARQVAAEAKVMVDWCMAWIRTARGTAGRRSARRSARRRQRVNVCEK
jgi:hypothetical protein